MSVYWSFMLILWIAAVGYFYMQIRKHNLPLLIVFDTAVLCLLLGLLVGHLAAAILKPWYFADYWKEFFFSLQGWRSGIASFGVIAGVIAALFLVSRLHHIPFALITDLSAPALFIGSAIGRIGCFFNGCCYGSPSSVPWAVSFNSITPTPPSHPVQLYESALSFLILLILPLITRWSPAKPGKGNLTLLCLLLYFFERSFLEIFRIGGTSQVIFMGLSRILLISMIGSLICLGLLAHNVKKEAYVSKA